ncbi:MAG: SUMF1/EgtB/PvdO family nonheme iron enzyme [Chloroflexota bacterium]
MSSTNTPLPETPAVEPFLSLTSIRDTHRDLLQSRRRDEDPAEFYAGVALFMQRAQLSGMYLDSDNDRWAVQNLLDYWDNQLFHAGLEPPGDPLLAEFQPDKQPEISDELCPYVGLNAFHVNDGSRFFGRDELIEGLIKQVSVNRLIAVVGPSGSGKSSVVLAGLVPRLEAGALPGSETWRYYRPIVPGSAPLAHLVELLKPADNADDALWTIENIEKLREDPHHLTQMINAANQETAVLVIDQFEETFTLCQDIEEREAFLNNLLNLVQAPNARHVVILTMRTDYESFLNKTPLFQNLFKQGQTRVASMNAAELRDAIEKPAQPIGLKFDDDLIDAIIREILGEPAALPLLQFALLKLWDNRERNRITWEAYRRIGGVMAALEHTAEEIYSSMIPEEQVTTRRIMMRLVQPSQGLEVTRARVRRRSLYMAGEAHDRIDRVLKKWIDARLIHLTPGDNPEDDQLEVAHEALVRNWPRLVGWLDDQRVQLRQRQRLTTQAEHWRENEEDPALLLRGSALLEVQEYQDLNSLESAFITKSLAERDREEIEKERIRQRERRFSLALAILAVISIIGVLAIFWSSSRANAAEAMASQAAATANAADFAATRAASDALAAQLENQQLAAQGTQEALNAQITLVAAQATKNQLAAASTQDSAAAQATVGAQEATATDQAGAIETSQAQNATRTQVEATGTNEAGRATSTAQADLAVTATAVSRATEAAEPPAPPSTLPTTTPSLDDLVNQFNEAAYWGTILREKDSMPMLYITGGVFGMGASRADPDAQDNELPWHEVAVTDFYLDRYEVNVQQYANFLNSIGGYKSNCGGGRYDCVATGFETTFTLLLNNVGIYEPTAGYGNYPINWVTWYGASDYCTWVGGRLPTEAEWEYAARSLDDRLYPWGNTPPPNNNLALFNQRIVRANIYDILRPVDAFPGGISPFGAFNMAGSMWEWVADDYAANYNNAPTDGSAYIDENNGEKVVRGGGWTSPAPQLRTSNRQPLTPTWENLDSERIFSTVGFRCAYDDQP